MLPESAPIISVDDHVIETPDLWQERLPAKFRDEGPTLIEVDGEQFWRYQGSLFQDNNGSGIAGTEYEDWPEKAPLRYDRLMPGCYDPDERIKDMDRDGVAVHLMFPTFPGHAGTRLLEANKDPELGVATVQAWNDWIIDEWVTPYPDRFIPISMVPMWDPAACAREIDRMAERGSRGITFCENPVPRGLPSFHSGHWDPMFAAVQANDMVVCTHFGSSGQVVTTAPEAPYAVTASLLANNAMAELADLVFSPVFIDFPDIKFALSEGGIGWIPYMLERLDRQWFHRRFSEKLRLDVKPSELFHKNMWGCSIIEEFGIAVREHIGVDRIMLESDYPHGDTTFPHTRKIATELLDDVPEAEARLIAAGTASTLFRFPLPADR